SSTEETTCMNCHNGHVAAKNISDEFNKPSFHPVDSRTGVHDPSETAVVNSRHVECADCHNPHAAKASAGIVAGPLTNVRGVDRNGNEIHPITAEYQLCFRCHADSNGKPAAPTARLYPETNVRLEFDTANPSYHPVVGAGKNPNVPSLINGLTTSSIIKCTDCHNNNSGPGAGGAGPNGPHGSNFNHLLERQFLTGDNVNESTSTYALCYKCHDRDSIRGDESFSEHRKHIFNENASCNICHDPHSSEAEKLINFDVNPNIVTPSSSGRLEYNSTGTFSGECYLSCHGKNHNPCSYGPGMGGGGMCGGGGGMGGM
ncbi:MAG: hypothetical protein OEZ33_10880, partial [Gammaproteobacteria bacterium]|nr:hypothetical protein [Gammaproteobacteria bacterium]